LGELISLKNQLNSKNGLAVNRTISGNLSPDFAITKILNIWGNPPINNSEPACGQVAPLGLGCYSTTGDFNDIRSLNRPVAINLTAVPPSTTQSSIRTPVRANWAALTSISANTATLWANQSEYQVSDSLLENWQGEYIVLWRMPPGYLSPISEGYRGATVDWLALQLSAFDNLPVIATSTAFDKSLTQRVQAFQRSVNLDPTGIVGPETWIHLNSIEGIGVPFLVPKQELTLGSDR